MRITRVVSSFSLLLATALAMAGPYTDLRNRLSAAPDSDKTAILKEFAEKDYQLAEIIETKGGKDAQTYVDLRAMEETGGQSSEQTTEVKKIKSSPLYHDEAEKSQANWLQGAIERLKNLQPKFDLPRPSGGAPNIGSAGGFFVYLMWFILAALVIGFLVFASRYIAFGKLKKRRAKAMLEDDEPERTLDEWLALADSYEREGLYREAVRALYLACLLRFDERNIARFMRGQTNWEHLARIEASPKYPSVLDFRSPTKAFDHIWYGKKVRGSEDVADFREWYKQVTGALEVLAA